MRDDLSITWKGSAADETGLFVTTSDGSLNLCRLLPLHSIAFRVTGEEHVPQLTVTVELHGDLALRGNVAVAVSPGDARRLVAALDAPSALALRRALEAQADEGAP